jgi:hypothetical protein
MRPFRYHRDPLFILACIAYVLNRWVLKPHLPSAFFHSHFNDLLLIPCALPPVLLAQRWLKLRAHDQSPQWDEIAFQAVVWSVLFEWIGPQLMRHATGDPWDVAAYLVGGLFAGLWWQRACRLPQQSPS